MHGVRTACLSRTLSFVNFIDRDIRQVVILSSAFEDAIARLYQLVVIVPWEQCRLLPSFRGLIALAVVNEQTYTPNAPSLAPSLRDVPSKSTQWRVASHLPNSLPFLLRINYTDFYTERFFSCFFDRPATHG